MSATSDLVVRLASAADEVAQDAFLSLPWATYRGTAGVSLAVDLAKQLTESGVLAKRAQANRMRQLLQGLQISEDHTRALAAAAREFSAHLRVTAADFLPPALRPTVYGGLPAVQVNAAASQGPTSPGLPDAGRGSQESLMSRTTARNQMSRSGDESSAFSTVLLLAHPDRQDANRRLLLGAKLDPLGVTLDGLQQILAESRDICGCVVDQSVLDTLDLDGQRALFSRLAAYSTFLHLRIHDTGLQVSRTDIAQIIKHARGLGNEVPYTAFSLQADYVLRPSEIEAFRRPGDLLRSRDGAEFILGELSQAESGLVVAATRSRIEAEGINGTVRVDSVVVRFLSGGRSGARLVTVRVNDEGRTFVAKITSKASALEEILRFRTFVQEWDPQLQPEAYFHGDAAVILFGLVQDDQNNTAPAEPLERGLENLWNTQWMRSEPHLQLVHREALGRGLERTARSLRLLNSMPVKHSGFDCLGNPSMDHVAALEAAGFDWGLVPDAVAARSVAVARFHTLECAAVVHGDVHLRNMLVRADGGIHLIDYAASGPGHPALDLARLELSLYLGPVRQFEEESRCVEFQRALSIERLSIDDLQLEFPTFFQCHVNVVCARGMVAARDEAIEAVRAHNGGPGDYLAAKYLLAWQYFGLIGSHTGLARAVIAALSTEIANSVPPTADVSVIVAPPATLPRINPPRTAASH